MHSLEHLFAEHLRNHSDAVLDFSPMGCQTGFYLMLQGEPAYDDVLDLVEATMRDIVAATEVPAANEVQCGWGANHSAGRRPGGGVRVPVGARCVVAGVR